MKVRGVIFIGISFLINSIFGQEGPDSMENAIKASEDIINRLLDKGYIPGIAVTVTKDSSTIWQKGYGYANIETQNPVDAESTLFRVASISKPIAATGLARMVMDSIIDLDASLYTYVPYFPKKEYDFTIRQLGGHLSGIRSYKGKEFINNKPLSIKEGIVLFKDDPLLFKPGTDYLYTSYNWNLIALAMEEASGTPFETYIKENVFVPLQLQHTMAETQDMLTGKAVFYNRRRRRKFREAPLLNNYYKLASGGYLSTSADMARLGNAYLYGNFIPESVAAQFLTAQRTTAKSTYYGVGWEVSLDRKRRPYYGHIGNGIGAYGFLYVYPEHKMVFSMLINVTNPGIDEELRTIIDLIIDGAFPEEK